MIKQGLRHSHKYGWQSEEIAAFIDQYLRDVKPLAQITNEKVEEGLVSGEIISSTPVEKATLHYTTDSGQEREKYHWQAIESKVEKNKWRIPLPAGITTWYVNITDVRGYQISGELHIGN